ncbi:hypothetical protein GCM10007301_19720 [Azorhizobium oxalatiphilum]|uniref:Uncharacterized protein n=1 Tax=Azorhizobium oxalatiphilum TaxID=980631 RepID=A0A917FBM7_9HYPH|nr:hypothetical protein GCM10007301_19720 [Azorhizobium oxalatiphilum]
MSDTSSHNANASENANVKQFNPDFFRVHSKIFVPTKVRRFKEGSISTRMKNPVIIDGIQSMRANGCSANDIAKELIKFGFEGKVSTLASYVLRIINAERNQTSKATT